MIVKTWQSPDLYWSAIILASDLNQNLEIPETEIFFVGEPDACTMK